MKQKTRFNVYAVIHRAVEEGVDMGVHAAMKNKKSITRKGADRAIEIITDEVMNEIASILHQID